MKKVEIYTSPMCGYCARAKKLLSQKRVQYSETNVLINPAKKSEMLKRSNGSRTVPQIFIGDKHVGGCDELFDLERSGKLDAMLAA
jgi:glutaredoxin 3